MKNRPVLRKLKRFSLFAVSICLVSAGLTGCSKAVQLDNEQQDLVAEYCAQLVLRYDANYDGKLEKVKEKETEKESSKENDKGEVTTDSNVSGENVTEEITTQGQGEHSLSLAEAFGIEGVDIQYTGYSIVDTYSDGSGSPANLVAGEGHSFLVEKFQMSNISGGTLDIPMMSFDTSIKSGVNGSHYTALITLLMNALNTYTGTMEPGQSTEVVLVYEINSLGEGDVSELILEVSENDRKATFNLK